jgi:cellulose synthase/poly-beta-1,6-N-acetylglucosamine synthase-like glycosyltransferase
MIDSTTWEEAVSRPGVWIRQRSRWIKGYIQTYLVHNRRPWEHFRRMGPAGALNFHMVFGGTIFALLVNPLYWALAMVWILFRPEAVTHYFPAWVFVMGLVCLVLGNFIFVYLAAFGCLARGYYHLVKFSLLSPVYWALMSVGAWKGALQLAFRPHFWEKTRHGLVRGRSAVPDEAA